MSNDNWSSGRVMRDPKGYLNPAEIRVIMNEARGLRNKLLIWLLATTGKRVSEILSLKVDDIDKENGRILWQILKRKKRLVKWKPCPASTLFRLNRYIEANNLKPDDYIFKSPYVTGKHLTRQQVFNIVRSIGKRAGIEYVGKKRLHPHHFRHSVAIILTKERGVHAAKSHLDHSNISVTDFYQQFGDKDLLEYAEVVDKIIKK
jgi:integrase/recombinase XerD